MKKIKSEISNVQGSLDERKVALAKEIDPLFKKYGLAIGAKVVYTETAIIAQPVLVDANSTAQNNVIEA